MVLMIAISSNSILFAAESETDDALSTLEYYINASVESGDKNLEDVSIGNSSYIYDGELNQYGFIFSLYKEKNEGYAIVLQNNNEYEVIETSLDTASPYKNNEALYYVYTGPFSYYTSNSEKDEKGNYILMDLESESEITNNELTNIKNISEENISTERISLLTQTVYLKNYGTSFVMGQQTNGYRCMPASFAMGLLYLHNTGQITLNSNYRNFTDIEEYLADKANVDDNHMGYANLLVTALKSFTSNYSNKLVTTKDDEFQPDTYFSTAKEEIDANCPLVLVFKKSTLYSVSHATTMVGYKRITNSDGTLSEYAIFVDPNTKTERTYKWSSSAIYGYMRFFIW